MIHGKEHFSLTTIGDMVQRTITINGFLTVYTMTGWRLSYVEGHYFTLCPPVIGDFSLLILVTLS